MYVLSIKNVEKCLIDYELFCFDGQPKIVFISKDISSKPRTDLFDVQFNNLPIRMRDMYSEVFPQI